MKYGAELLQELERDLERGREEFNRREAKLDNMDMELGDCFLSRAANQLSTRLTEEKIAILKDGGFRTFKELYWIDTGLRADWYWAQTKFGSRVLVKREDGELVWSSGKPQSLTNKGLEWREVTLPAWACIGGSGHGTSGMATAYIKTFPSDTNYWTGEKA
jgi:hypothetical protein